MGLFTGRGKGGGLMNVIRCDEQDYLVWKWRPLGQEANSTTRENSIRWGSSLRVKDGEVAAFVYKQKDGTMQDFIEGPFDQTLKTANLPILANIVGLAYGGEAPFQAEVYFINLSGVIQQRFTVPYFDIQDPRFPDMSVPVAVSGTITFKITDYKEFVKLNRLINFTLEDFKAKVNDAVVRRIKGTVTNVLYQLNCPLVQIERSIESIGDIVRDKLKPDMEEFGVTLSRFDIARIEPDKECDTWHKLQQVTSEYAIRNTALNQDIAMETARAQADINIQNMRDTQAINSQNMAETLRLQREQAAYAQQLQSQQANIGAFQVGQQADVLKAAANNLGQMGTMNLGGGGGGGFNAAGMMTGMAVGGAMGQQMAAMMGQMGQNMQQGMGQPGAQQPGMGQQMAPPPVPGAAPQPEFMIVVNGQQAGPFSVPQLIQLQGQGSFAADTLVWKQGMPAWAAANTVPELQTMFMQGGGVPPIPGGMPGVPPTPPTPPTV